jgi:predicted transcriptional regulator
MLEKGLVRRDDRARRHTYLAALPRKTAQHRLVADLLESAFHGSASVLVQRALAASPVSEEELREIEGMVRAAREAQATPIDKRDRNTDDGEER